ncbi:hypothetical protein [Gloeocapsopsis sp. IPPAS B-1203]|uniref:hypothetical protein n=1 Tax=Gloeocapsopsis sp. IPPAS B-1203 TaxID=2049454 RepID=UPI000C19E802|nr:hypothetical protein [Gloeocapsopsis sp. IPPAS B-1203]PIG93721.1 hypothetical protein CSQ79_08815 [Gloeocapsopsis sp. IPPAS B-1203]
MTTANPEDYGYQKDKYGIWRKESIQEYETPSTVNSHSIRMDSPELLNADRVTEAEQSANYVKSLYEKQQRIEKTKAEKAARLAQEKLDEINADPEISQGKLSRRLVTPRNEEERARLRPLEAEEVAQLKRLKKPHDDYVAKKHQEFIENQYKLKQYGDDAARENLLRLISGMTKEQKAIFNKELGLK